jgi:hypothetical protein
MNYEDMIYDMLLDISVNWEKHPCREIVELTLETFAKTPPHNISTDYSACRIFRSC